MEFSIEIGWVSPQGPWNMVFRVSYKGKKQVDLTIYFESFEPYSLFLYKLIGNTKKLRSHAKCLAKISKTKWDFEIWGVDFVFPCHKKNNPHLTFSRREGPTCLVGVWKVSNRCLAGIRIVSGFWKVSGRYLEGVWKKVSGGSQKGVWKMLWTCVE